MHRVRFFITLFVLTALGAALVWRGFDYYRQTLIDRAAHRDYRVLNPAGSLGHGYGIAGTVLISANLLYLVRRRLASSLPPWIGSVGAWLSAHAFTGLVGSLLVVFHSAFQLRTPIATLTSVSLAIVVTTGLVGLYLHALVPKSGQQPLKVRLAEIGSVLPNMASEVDRFVQATPATQLPHDASLLRAVVTIPRWVYESRRRRRGIAEAARRDKVFRVLEHTEPRLARSFLVELGDLAAAEIGSLRAGSLLRSWRSLHRFLALLMLISVSGHIAVAWYYGFRWIF